MNAEALKNLEVCSRESAGMVMIKPAQLKRLLDERRAAVLATKALMAWGDHEALTGLPHGQPVADSAPSFDTTVNLAVAAVALADTDAPDAHASNCRAGPRFRRVCACGYLERHPEELPQRTHLSSCGTTMDGSPRRACGCQSCRHRFGAPVVEANVKPEDDDDENGNCSKCNDPFTDSGPAAQSLAAPGICVYCYTEGA